MQKLDAPQPQAGKACGKVREGAFPEVRPVVLSGQWGPQARLCSGSTQGAESIAVPALPNTRERASCGPCVNSGQTESCVCPSTRKAAKYTHIYSKNTDAWLDPWGLY